MYLLYELIIWFGTLQQGYTDVDRWVKQHVEVYGSSTYCFSINNHKEDCQELTIKFKGAEGWYTRYLRYNTNFDPDLFPTTIKVGKTNVLFDYNYGDVIIFGDEIRHEGFDYLNLQYEDGTEAYRGSVPSAWQEKVIPWMRRSRR